MLGFFKKKPQGSTISFKIEGMHCPSCGMNIDGELEEKEGIISATTSYAQAETTVEYDPDVLTADDIQKQISELGYTAQ